nr:arginase family protein [Kineococcus siccus]
MADGLARVEVTGIAVDLDVLDVSVGRANGYAAPGGLLSSELLAVVRTAATRLPLASATLASWDPDLDVDGRVAAAALDVLAEIGAALRNR